MGCLCVVCLVYVLSMSCLCLVYVLSMSCLCLVYVLSMSCLSLVYVYRGMAKKHAFFLNYSKSMFLTVFEPYLLHFLDIMKKQNKWNSHLNLFQQHFF